MTEDPDSIKASSDNTAASPAFGKINTVEAPSEPQLPEPEPISVSFALPNDEARRYIEHQKEQRWEQVQQSEHYDAAPDWFKNHDPETHVVGMAVSPTMSSSRNFADLDMRTNAMDPDHMEVYQYADGRTQILGQQTLSGLRVSNIERYETDDGNILTFVGARLPGK